MHADVDLVRARADLAEIASRYGVKLRKSGKHFVALCPFHQEKGPSFTVAPAKGLFHCFGCGAGGDVLSFVQRIEHVDFPRALAMLADLVGVRLSGDNWITERRREYAAQQTSRALSEHFRMIEGYPERERYPAERALAARCGADAGYLDWLAEDLEQAEQICAVIVGLLALSQERNPRAEAPAA